MEVTVLEAIQKSTEFLAKKNVESPRLQTELLLGRLLKMPRMKLYLNFNRVLSPTETDGLRELIKRRGTREPLQHIVGSTCFCGLEITVNRQALIPRPETELLAEAGWQFLGQGPSAGHLKEEATVSNPAGESAALDFGTGTGCIAIALATKCPAAQITALDVSPEALALAKENAAKNGVGERIRFLQGNGFGALAGAAEATDWSFDLVISNPPYIASAEIATLEPEVRDFDPRAALDGGADGLDFYRMLAAEAGDFLKARGKVMLEFGDGQAEAIRAIFEQQNWIVEGIRDDYSQRARMITARKGEQQP